VTRKLSVSLCVFSCAVNDSLPDVPLGNYQAVLLYKLAWLTVGMETYERVLLGGLTCDSDDYYNSEQNMNAIYFQKYNKEKPSLVFSLIQVPIKKHRIRWTAPLL
jgi:hypothetical protein